MLHVRATTYSATQAGGVDSTVVQIAIVDAFQQVSAAAIIVLSTSVYAVGLPFTNTPECTEDLDPLLSFLGRSAIVAEVVLAFYVVYLYLSGE